MINFLFSPESIAVIGASMDPQKVGYAVLNNIKKYHFMGDIFPVNPKSEEILGLKTYQSIGEISRDVDLAVIAIPAQMVPETLGDCIQKGVKSAVIISAGFKEAGTAGIVLEEELKALVRESGIRVLGPNCLGIINTSNKAVITGAHRSDIQLAALETSTKCIILTGGMYTNDVILGKAKIKGVPILSVHDDTYTTVEKIESVLGKIRIREQKKVLKTKEIVEKEFDLKRLLEELKN